MEKTQEPDVPVPVEDSTQEAEEAVAGEETAEPREPAEDDPVSLSPAVPETPERVLRVPDVELPDAEPPKEQKPVDPETGTAETAAGEKAADEAVHTDGPAATGSQLSDRHSDAQYIGKSVLGAVRVVKFLFEVTRDYSRFETMYRVSLRRRYAALAEEKEKLAAENEALQNGLETAETRIARLEEELEKQTARADSGVGPSAAATDSAGVGPADAGGTEGEGDAAAAGAAGREDAAADADGTEGGRESAEEPYSAERAESTTGPDDESEWMRKHVYAVPEDVIAVSMGGAGWIYLGEKNGKEGITFKARKNSPRATEFIFQTEELGEYFLRFQQQDLFTGEERWQEVRVSVVNEERFAEILTAKRSGREEDPEMMDASPKGYILADTYYREGRKEEALAEYIKNYTEGNPRINDRIASLSFEQGKYSRAEEFWRKNLYENDLYREKAVVGIVRTAIRRNDLNAFEKMLPDLLDADTVPTAEPLIEGARFQIENGNNVSAAHILETFLTQNYDHEKADWAYFTLGNLHEQSGPLRNFKKAKYYYRVVLNDFPASSYWDKAEERIRYIDMYLLKAR